MLALSLGLCAPGLQAQLWGETVRTRSHQNYMLFPRILALAERAWHKAAWEDMHGDQRKKHRDEDWEQFANTVGYRELKRLEELDIHYRLPPPAAMSVLVGYRIHNNLQSDKLLLLVSN